MRLSDLHHIDRCLSKVLCSNMETEETENPQKTIMDEFVKTHGLIELSSTDETCMQYQMPTSSTEKEYYITVGYHTVGWDHTTETVRTFYYDIRGKYGESIAIESSNDLEEWEADLKDELDEIKENQLQTITEEDSMKGIEEGINDLDIDPVKP